MPSPGQTATPTPTADIAKAKRVKDACESNWEAHKGDCSGFVKAVAAELGVVLSGQANAIVDFIKANWTAIDSGVTARDWAKAGYLVVGGLKASPHGHVVVVVDGPLAFGKYPSAYWGRLGGSGQKDKTVNYSWNSTDRDKVRYYGAIVQN